MLENDYFQKAQEIFRQLQSRPKFEHFGKNSRGIPVFSSSTFNKFAELADQYQNSPLDYAVLVLTGALLKRSMDLGGYLRFKGDENSLGIDIRGEAPLFDGMTTQEVFEAARRLNGLELQISAEGDVKLNLHYSKGTIDPVCIDGLNEAQRHLHTLKPEKKAVLASQIITIIADLVEERGEFPRT